MPARHSDRSGALPEERLRRRYVDTNANPDTIDYIIPGNDDAMRAIKLIVDALADAVKEGKAMRKGDDEGFEEEASATATAAIDYDSEEEDENDER